MGLLGRCWACDSGKQPNLVQTACVDSPAGFVGTDGVCNRCPDGWEPIDVRLQKTAMHVMSNESAIPRTFLASSSELYQEKTKWHTSVTPFGAEVPPILGWTQENRRKLNAPDAPRDTPESMVFV
jgi:hypothetical protein